MHTTRSGPVKTPHYLTRRVRHRRYDRGCFFLGFRPQLVGVRIRCGLVLARGFAFTLLALLLFGAQAVFQEVGYFRAKWRIWSGEKRLALESFAILAQRLRGI